MLILENKSNVCSLNEFHNYLYDLEGNNDELADIFYNIDNDIQKIYDRHHEQESEIKYYKEENERIQEELTRIIKAIKKGKYMSDKEELISELQILR